MKEIMKQWEWEEDEKIKWEIAELNAREEAEAARERGKGANMGDVRFKEPPKV